jgi:glutamyl-tRNA synthetase
LTTGRFAPSPTGELHLGNLRTAVLAWCLARREGGRFLIRMEDLTTEKVADAETQQLDDLASLGITSDAEIVRSSERLDLYRSAISQLSSSGLTYPCFCSRREIREAVAAPHDTDVAGGYPGTCAELDDRQRSERVASGRPPALRLRAREATVEVRDELGARVSMEVDDFVLQRGDGLPAYNLAVVVDDAAQAVDQVVRGADLLDTTPRQVLLARLLGIESPRYMHVPLVVGVDGERLSKRHGAVTLADIARRGVGPNRVLGMFAKSVGLSGLADEVAI